jgi:hypothetical protein
LWFFQGEITESPRAETAALLFGEALVDREDFCAYEDHFWYFYDRRPNQLRNMVADTTILTRFNCLPAYSF